MSLDRTRACLLGGAVGDALGAGIEFDTLAEIRAAHGAEGVTGYVRAYGRHGAITDDTQMTLFTAEGLMRGFVGRETRGGGAMNAAIHHAYLRWLRTQDETAEHAGLEVATDGWLFAVPALHAQRAPGNTCLDALYDSAALGQSMIGRNNSKGCGAVMRAAPVGLFAAALGDDGTVFDVAARSGAITHGHPSGFLAAGHLAVTVAGLLRGAALPAALDAADFILAAQPEHDELARALAAARRLAAAGRPRPEALQALGGGWVGEEALAIAVCCALAADGFADGVLLAVNHSGDSDSTGAIAGNLLGAIGGTAAIPAPWLDGLELRTEIDRIATDLHALASGGLSPWEAAKDYPGY